MKIVSSSCVSKIVIHIERESNACVASIESCKIEILYTRIYTRRIIFFSSLKRKCMHVFFSDRNWLVSLFCNLFFNYFKSEYSTNQLCPRFYALLSFCNVLRRSRREDN